MDLKNRIILEEYRKNRGDFCRMGEIVGRMLDDIVAESGVRTLSTQHRVKSEKAGTTSSPTSWTSWAPA